MRTLESFLAALLINSAWQVPLVSGAAWVASRTLRECKALFVHRFWVGTLLLQASLPALTALPWSLPAWVPRLHQPLQSESAFVSVSFGPGSAGAAQPFTATLFHAAAIACAVLLLHSLANLALALCRTARLVQLPQHLPDTQTVDLWQQCCERFQVPHAQLRVAPVQTPLTFGVWLPRVLLPEGLLGCLRPADRHAVLAHECAHIQRGDYGLNLLYEVLTLPIRYHPALRLTRARLAETREWVCDEAAAAVMASPAGYPRSLLRLAALLAQREPFAATHAIGMLDANAMERRLMHLTSNSRLTTPRRRLAALCACTLLGVATTASAWALRTGMLHPASAQASEPATQSVPSGVMAGNVLTHVPPVYPSDAKAAHLQGSVVLHAIISAEGVVENLTVVSGPEPLRASAIEAVRQWTYKPYLLNNEPVTVQTDITINYQLQD